MYQNAAVLAAFLLIYSAIAGRVERSWISGPVIFTGVGLILGSDGLGVLRSCSRGSAYWRWRCWRRCSRRPMPAIGLALTWCTTRMLRFAERRGWIGEHWAEIPIVALAAACFAAAQAVGGSGFIACFVGGLLLSALRERHRRNCCAGPKAPVKPWRWSPGWCSGESWLPA
jgi:NhaP-type Na+/H+ and K+/H+ antiporter